MPGRRQAILSFAHNGRTRLCDGWSRREVLRVGGLSALGLSLSDWLRIERAGAARPNARAKSVILIFNCGAPSHIDLWDLKPDAPAEVRGPFKPIKTNVPGIEISELLPNLARHADKYSIVRTVNHTHTQHNPGMYWSIVGKPYRIDSTLINPSRSDDPSFGTLVGWLAQKEGHRGPVPPYIITPSPHCDSTVYITPGQYGGMLGAAYDPFVLNSDPNAANFKVPNIEPSPGMSVDRLKSRQALLERLDRGLQSVDLPAGRDMRAAQERAFSMVTSQEVRKAFDLTHESPKTRERYGRHPWGQSHLLARRLVEAGARFVTTVNGQSIVWDTHKDNFNGHKNRLVPPMEKAFTALLEDLSERGLLDSTLVIWMGDFGRTPKINPDAGRDHWPHCYSVVMAGGGIRGGQVVGESDKEAAFPVSRPVSPADIHATVFAALGYDPHKTTYTSPDGRPLILSEGEPIRELL